MIPKILHQVWTGSKPIPKDHQELVKQFRRINPDWKYMLWTDEAIDDMNFDCSDLWEGKPPIVKADIARYAIIHALGGVYADVDFYFVKSMNDLLNTTFFGTFTETWRFEIYNGLFGSQRHNPLMRYVVNSIRGKKLEGTDYKSLFNYCGTYHFTDCIVDNDGDTKDYQATLHPLELFYPTKATTQVMKKFRYKDIQPFITDSTYAVHLWWQSWM